MTESFLSTALSDAPAGTDGSLVLVENVATAQTALAVRFVAPSEEMRDLLHDSRASREDMAGWRFLGEDALPDILALARSEGLRISASRILHDGECVLGMCETPEVCHAA